ncbi:MAG: macro domain-containing protein [Gemmataceae bacterium]|nr:macro domain-containing protein [Gemmataceae bacterium]
MLASLMRWLRRRRVAVLKPFGPVPPGTLRVTVGDRSEEVADRLARHFHAVPGVEVVQGDLLDLDADALVSPANSFGDMGGGIDKAIDDFHGGEAQRRVRAAIEERFLGELPVGAALVVEMPSQRFPFLVCAPTMRVPGPVAGTLNAYLAMRAACVAALLDGRIRSLAVPGLCTGVGAMPADRAAEQMRAAYDSTVGGGWREARHPALAPFALEGAR